VLTAVVRIQIDIIPVTDGYVHRGRLVVKQYKANLGVRHAERFDHVFQRWSEFEVVLEGRVSPLGRKEIVELRVEAEVSGFHSA
jgi:hypothetical protein